MQPTTMMDMQRSGNLGGQKVAMKFDENSIAHIMSVLTDLYSDPVMAVIREYSTNAYDSHIAAGQTRPIEVYTPTSFSPFFRVKDYGLGLSVDDVENIYSKYGASTKRGTDTQVGMLGLGCKSALTYTNQFIIVAVKGGIRTTVAVSRIEDGTGEMTIVDTCATDEPNGVEIQVPSRNADEFRVKAERFFRFWKPGTVLVNDREPQYIEGQMISKRTMLVDGLDQDYVVMGNVAYPLKETMYAGKPWGAGWNTVSFVEIGSVNFTPSREQLHYTHLTNSTVATLRNEFQQAMIAVVQKDIDAADTHAEAMERFQNWKRRVNVNSATYRGVEIKENWRFDHLYYRPYQARYSVSENNYQDYKTLVDQTTVVVTGWPQYDGADSDFRKPTTTQKAKMRHAFPGASRFILTDTMPGAPWTNAAKTMTFDEVKAVKLPKSDSSGSRKAVVTYSVLDLDNGTFVEVELDDIDATNLYYVTPSEAKGHMIRGLYRVLDDVTVVHLGQNRVAKFLKEFPTAKQLVPMLLDRYNAARKALTDADKATLNMDYSARTVLKDLDETRVDDPEVVELIHQARGLKAGTATLKEWESVTQIGKVFNWSIYLQAVPTNLFRNYPLLRSANGWTEHAYTYINAVYAARREEK